ncbi:MAG: DUF998 domain-containing protein [Acidimicrobiales bacterium]
MPRTRLWCAAASGFVLAATVLVVGCMTPGYSQWADTVSRLGSRGQPDALAARAGIVASAVLLLAAAAPLGAGAPGRERLVAGLLRTYGIGGVVAGLAPKDPPAAADTLASAVHVAATIVGGVGVVGAIVVVAAVAPTQRHRRASAATAAMASLGVVAFRLSWGSPVYGLVERFLLGLAALWVVAQARSVASSRPPPRRDQRGDRPRRP